MTFKDWPGGGTGDVTYCYDAEGRQTDAVYGGTCASDPGVHNGYDAIGRLTSSIVNLGGNTRAMSWAYDADGNRTSIVYPGPNAFTEQYDGIDRPVRLLDFYANVLDTFTYWATGERAGITRFNAQNTSYSYDGIGRLDTLGQPWVNVSFQYNAASQATQRTISNDDFVYRQRWDVNRPYAVNGLNQYSAVHGATYGYDLNGNLTSDGSTTYGYDIENRLTSATGQLNGTLSYDPLGRLWQTTGASGTVQYFYDGDDLAVEYDGANNILRRYLHGPGADEPQMWYEGPDYSQPRWYHQDHQSSVIAITDYSGNRIATNTYDEYGNPTPGNTGRFQYTGQLWLKDFQLYHYKARAYSPWLGRFMQTDPVGYKDQINLYAYVGDDPINRDDPTGQDEFDVFRPIYRGIAYHEAEYVGSDRTGWTYLSKDGAVNGGVSGPSKYEIQRYDSFKDVVRDASNRGYTEGYLRSESAQQDISNIKATTESLKKDYNGIWCNCGQAVRAGEKAAGASGEDHINPKDIAAYEASDRGRKAGWQPVNLKDRQGSQGRDGRTGKPSQSLKSRPSFKVCTGTYFC